jgi:hypothetical protein
MKCGSAQASANRQAHVFPFGEFHGPLSLRDRRHIPLDKNFIAPIAEQGLQGLSFFKGEQFELVNDFGLESEDHGFLAFAVFWGGARLRNPRNDER